ncbi:MAG: PD-(D/E)XK nuclease family protein [Alphaproteobacteria bacterium]|nr:PD-(D/E)XK nuclease family protein [Alphaproteobacteria bacterium]
MIEHKPLSLYRAPFGVALSDVIAEHLLKRHQTDLTALADGVIYLPTRRAVHGLRQAFLAHAHKGGKTGKNFLLPHMVALGDVGPDALEEDLGMYHSDIYHLSDNDSEGDIFGKTPVASHARLLALAKIIINSGNFDVHHGQALAMAHDLARLLDGLQIIGKNIGDLDGIQLSKDYAHHWQRNITFLKNILQHHWQAYLQKYQQCDVVAYNHHMLRLETDRINRQNDSQNDNWYLVAGSTASRPQIAKFLHHIMQHPKGEVVVSGYLPPRNLADAEAICADSAHPLHILYNNIERWQAKSDLPIWGKMHDTHMPDLHHIFRSARLTTALQVNDTQIMPEKIPEKIPDHIQLIEAESIWQEANIIALMIRQGIAEQQKILLVTADNELARRVVLLMNQRYHIDVDATHGMALQDTMRGRYLLLLTRCWQENFTAPERLIALLQHPFSCFGQVRENMLRELRKLQYRVRNARNAPDELTLHNAFLSLLNCKPAIIVAPEQKRSLAQWLDGLIELAKDSARTNDTPNGGGDDTEELHPRLFQDQDGLACWKLLEKLRSVADDYTALNIEDFYQLLRFFLSQETYRPQGEFHPDITIVGRLESRMLYADRIILGGLTEGAWPNLPQADLWFNREIRQKLELPERNVIVGQSAHDFWQLLSAKQVFITLPQKVNGSLQNESRFVTRLKLAFPKWAEAQKNNANQKHSGQKHLGQWREWADVIYHRKAEIKPLIRPKIKIENAMPETMFVTSLNHLLQNPYGFYAANILHLRALPHFFDDNSASDWGNLVHKILESDDLSLENLRHSADTLIEKYQTSKIRQKLMRVRLEPILRFVAKQMIDITRHYSEHKGQFIWKTEHSAFTLRGKADLLMHNDGAYSIIDYKTGAVPNIKDCTDNMLESQLPLLGLMLQQGGFENVNGQDIELLGYWKLSSRDNKKHIITDDAAETDGLIKKYHAEISKIWDEYQKGARVFEMRLDIEQKYDDYQHLARKQEWWGA